MKRTCSGLRAEFENFESNIFFSFHLRLESFLKSVKLLK